MRDALISAAPAEHGVFEVDYTQGQRPGPPFKKAPVRSHTSYFA